MRRIDAFAVTGVALALLLTGCSRGEPAPAPSRSTSTLPPASVAPVPPSYDPTAGAEGNRAFFDQVAGAVRAADQDAAGRAYVDALVAAGFDRTAMELTSDTTAIGLDADSVQFSVRFPDGCIIGQSGDAMGYLSTLSPVLGTGRCLSGETRPIDW